MLDEPDDVRIRGVAQGLAALMGPRAAATELVRLYGRMRTVQALQHSGPFERPGTPSPGDIVVDLVEARPVTIDLRDSHVPTAAGSPVPRRAVSAYAHRSAAAPRLLEAAGRTLWL